MTTNKVGITPKEAYIAKQTGKSIAQIARDFNCSPRTVSRRIADYIKQYDERDAIDEELETVEDVIKAVEEPVEYTGVATMKSISITQFKGNESVSCSISNDDPKFESYVDLILQGGGLTQEIMEQIFSESRPALIIDSFTEGRLTFDIENRAVTFDYGGGAKYEVPNSFVSKVIDIVKEKGKDKAINAIRLLDKLYTNPSPKVVNELYGFLAHNDIEINDDGTFMAYKKVRSTYKDIHTNTIDNSVGSAPKMPRHLVNANSAETCSYGLHVCAKQYLSHFGSWSGGARIVKCKVDPYDVVSIPLDYNNSKMRCSQYEVVEDVTDTFDIS